MEVVFNPLNLSYLISLKVEGSIARYQIARQVNLSTRNFDGETLKQGLEVSYYLTPILD